MEVTKDANHKFTMSAMVNHGFTTLFFCWEALPWRTFRLGIVCGDGSNRRVANRYMMMCSSACPRCNDGE
jgi:hypothetical protein